MGFINLIKNMFIVQHQQSGFMYSKTLPPHTWGKASFPKQIVAQLFDKQTQKRYRVTNKPNIGPNFCNLSYDPTYKEQTIIIIIFQMKQKNMMELQGQLPGAILAFLNQIKNCLRPTAQILNQTLRQMSAAETVPMSLGALQHKENHQISR